MATFGEKGQLVWPKESKVFGYHQLGPNLAYKVEIKVTLEPSNPLNFPIEQAIRRDIERGAIHIARLIINESEVKDAGLP